MENNGKTAIVTGAYGAIGQAVAAGIAAAGYTTVLVGRDSDRLEKTKSLLVKRTGNPAISCEVADLGRQRDIRDVSLRLEGPLHLLVNNAATAPRRRTETAEGIEVQWAVNVLGYYWMMHYFIPLMAGISGGRIVNVASYWAGGLDLQDPEFRKRGYDNDAAYRQAKQADRMLSRAFAGRLDPGNVTVNSCHPGDVNSKLSNAFGFGGSESPEEGAATPLYLSLSGELNGVTGRYYEHLREASCPFVRDAAAVEELFRLCGSYTVL
jgi:NAD(P)-dependent dehydrogenase (short-subunit alcohol dehydrogenase family)